MLEVFAAVKDVFWLLRDSMECVLLSSFRRVAWRMRMKMDKEKRTSFGFVLPLIQQSLASSLVEDFLHVVSLCDVWELLRQELWGMNSG